MASLFIKGILIGLLFGLPFGAIGVLTVQRTLKFGVKLGLLTGLGSSIADCLYATVGAFGLTLISDFLLKYQVIINILGGGFILFLGIRLLIKKEDKSDTTVESASPIKTFLSSLAIGITNPATVLTFIFAFSYFKISDINSVGSGISLVTGVFLGTYIWWSVLTFATFCIKKKAEHFHYAYLNRVFGILLIIFSIVIYIRLLTN